MTRERHIGKDEAFEAWLRHHPRFPSTQYDRRDLDVIWFKYKPGWYMLLSKKCFGGQSNSYEKDTYGVIDQACRKCNGGLFETLRGKRPLVYRGLHYLRFEKENPEDGWIELDGRRISREQLERFLENGED